jgi:hypothetical protein
MDETTTSDANSMGVVDDRNYDNDEESLSTLEDDDNIVTEVSATDSSQKNDNISGDRNSSSSKGVELTFASSLAMADRAFWDPSTDLYKAVQALQTTQQQQQQQQLSNPSASQAEVMAQQLYDKIDECVSSQGNKTQKKLWQAATLERRHTLVASFFLPSGLVLRYNN